MSSLTEIDFLAPFSQVAGESGGGREAENLTVRGSTARSRINKHLTSYEARNSA